MKGSDWNELQRVLQSLSMSGVLTVESSNIKTTLEKRNSPYVSHKQINFEKSNIPDESMYIHNEYKELWINPIDVLDTNNYVETLIPTKMVKKIFETELETLNFKVLHTDLVSVRFKIKPVIKWEFNEEESKFTPLFAENNSTEDMIS